LNKKFIVDASFLILLNNQNRLDLIKKCVDRCNIFYIPKNVEDEIHNFDEIKNIINNKDKYICNMVPDDKIFNRIYNRYPSLGKGEISVMSLYLEKLDYDYCCLLDDDKARIIAESQNIKKHGSIWFIEKCYYWGFLSQNDALDFLNEVKSSPFRISRFLIDETISKVKNSKI